MLDATINTPGANTQQPFVAGNILYYASDKAGSTGGFDLWYATLDLAGTPSNPQQLFITPLDHIEMFHNVFRSRLIPFIKDPLQKFDTSEQLELF